MIIIANRIVELNLHDTAISLHKQFSINRVCKIINEKYLPEGENPISHMTFQRFFKNLEKHPIATVNNEITSASEDEVNPYDEMKSLAETIDLRIDALDEEIKALDELRKSKSDLGSVPKWMETYNQKVSLLEKLVARKQSLLNDIGSYQKEIATYQNMKEVIRIMVDTLKSYPGAYDTFKQQLEGNTKLINLCK